MELNRQELNSLLLSLEQLEQNEIFKLMLSEMRTLHSAALASACTVPATLQMFLSREQMLGGAAELKRLLDFVDTTREDLNAKLNQLK